MCDCYAQCEFRPRVPVGNVLLMLSQRELELSGVHMRRRGTSSAEGAGLGRVSKSRFATIFISTNHIRPGNASQAHQTRAKCQRVSLSYTHLAHAQF